MRALRSAAEVRRRHFGLIDFDRRDEAIAASADGGHVSTTGLAFAQRPSERRDMNFEVAILNEGVGPGPGHEVALADEITPTLDESGEDLEGSAAQANRRFTLQQELLCRKEPERAERKCTFARGRRLIVHLLVDLT